MNTLEIVIGSKDGDAYRVTSKHSRSGDFLRAQKTGWLAIDPQVLPYHANGREYGEALGNALFQGGSLSAFITALALARADNEPLHVLLEIDNPELKPLHWELLCAPFDSGWDFLSLNQETPFSIDLPSPVDQRFQNIGRPDLRALLLVAGMDDVQFAEGTIRPLDEFDVPGTVLSVRDAIRAALGVDRCDVLANAPEAAGRPDLPTLCDRITGSRYTILHIICHGQYSPGKGETRLYLPGEDGRAIEGKRFIERLRGLRGKYGLPHFVFLMSCESAIPEAENGFGSLAQNLVRDLGMPAVLAMTGRVSIPTANALAVAYYRRLVDHGHPDLALAEALSGLQGRYDANVPAVFSRLSGRPIFSDTQGRTLSTLSAGEIEAGLKRLRLETPARAPSLIARLEETARQLEWTTAASQAPPPADADPVDEAKLREEHLVALGKIDSLCAEISGVGFLALALKQPLDPYDSTPPFLGLLPFHYEDQRFFCGREPLVKELVERLAGHPFLAVVGRSGSGKSSLVEAGLAPALMEGEPDLALVTFTPRADPLAQLDAALARVKDPAKTLLVVDQFEEVFTLCKNEDERKDFIHRVLAVAEPYRVVLTMRADFWGECAPYPELEERMKAHQKLIDVMSLLELHQAILDQAGKVGLRLEAGLASAILDDVRNEPGRMPLLQHALLELWNRRHGRWLRADEYYAFGGVQKAIAATAENVYERLSPALRLLMRDIFIRLTRLDESAQAGEARHTRQRATMGTLVPVGSDPTVARSLVADLATDRLIATSYNAVSEQDEVEVAHEALIQAWDRLAGWLKEDHDLILVRSEVSRCALDWHNRQRKRDYLRHQGELLEEALKLLTSSRLPVNPLEREYLLACRNERLQGFAGREEELSGVVEVELVYFTAQDGSGRRLEIHLDRPGEAAGAERAYTQSKPYQRPMRAQTELAPAELAKLAETKESYGQYLSRQLFGNEALTWYFRSAVDGSAKAEAFLNLDIIVGPSVSFLHAFTWETLSDPLTGDTLASDPNIGIARYLAGAAWSEEQRLRPKPNAQVRALVAAAYPAILMDSPDLTNGLGDVTEMAAIAGEALQKVQIDYLVSDPAAGRRVTLDNLRAALRQGCDIFYLACHGELRREEPLDPDSPLRPYLILENQEGRAHRVEAEELTASIRELPPGNQPRLVVLAAAQSGGAVAGPDGAANNDRSREGPLAVLALRLVEAGVPAVVAMQGLISIQTAAEFTRAFFIELLVNGQVERAMAAARGQIRFRPDWWSPALYLSRRGERLWYQPGFGPKRDNREPFNQLAASLNDSRCTPVLGPGLFEPLLGRLDDVASAWTDLYGYPGDFFQGDSLPEVAQFLSIYESERFPRRLLTETIQRQLLHRYSELKPGPLHELIRQAGAIHRQNNPLDPHRLLAELPVRQYLTINPDYLLEDALIEQGKRPYSMLFPWNPSIEQTDSDDIDIKTYLPTVKQPFVYHLLGVWDQPDSLVLTQDDFYNYLREYHRIGLWGQSPVSSIPSYLIRDLVRNSLLILGFQWEEMRDRILLSHLSSPEGMQRPRPGSVATATEPESWRAQEYLYKYLASWTLKLEVYWGTAEDFLRDLIQFYRGDREP